MQKCFHRIDALIQSNLRKIIPIIAGNDEAYRCQAKKFRVGNCPKVKLGNCSLAALAYQINFSAN